MIRVLTAAVFLLLAAPVLAGPNAGGVLVVHDIGILYCDDQQEYPTPPPASCREVDNELPLGLPPPGMSAWLWKVYAAFPDGASPRLKAFPMACAFPAQVVVSAGGLPDAVADFEISQGGWPTTSGGGVGISFGTTKTAQIVECYWFAGYAYDQPGLWQLTPHPTQPMLFVDDSLPPLEDPIAALSSLGFGQPGETNCPGGPLGACCDLPLHCIVVTQAECDAICGYWVAGASCDPSPCMYGHGACCSAGGSCEVIFSAECEQTGGTFLGGCCDPNPCPNFGACCIAGACFVLPADGCAAQGGVFVGGECVDGLCVIPTEATTWGRVKRTSW